MKQINNDTNAKSKTFQAELEIKNIHNTAACVSGAEHHTSSSCISSTGCCSRWRELSVSISPYYKDAPGW